MKSNERSVLVTAPNWLGDAVMSLPLIGYLSAVQGLRVALMAPPYSARVYWGVDGIDDLIVLPKTGRLRNVVERSRTIRRIGFDAGILLPPSLSSALTLFVAGVRHRIGFPFDGRSLLLSVHLPTSDLREEHLSENYLRLGREVVERLQLDEDPAARTPVLKVSTGDRQSLEKVLESRGAPCGDYAVVVPGATYGSTKSWPADKYRTVVERLAGTMPVILAGAAGERALCEAVGGGVRGVFNLAGDTSLGTFFALLEGARVVIANDSGAPHVAGSLGVPVVVIFGSTSPRWTRPLGPEAWVVREHVDCSPCFRRECPTRLECYEGITPDRVCDVVFSALNRAVEHARSADRV